MRRLGRVPRRRHRTAAAAEHQHGDRRRTGAPGEGGEPNCDQLERKAKKASQRAGQLRRKAKKSASADQAQKLRKQAKQAAKQAEKLEKEAKACTQSSGGGGK